MLRLWRRSRAIGQTGSNVAKRILVVDDDPAIRRIMRAMLATRGYEVGEAESGEDALKLIGSENYDLVLVDINLPGISGFEVCREVRINSEMIIVLMSSGEENRNKALRAGANDYLRKPFGVSQIFACVESNLRQREEAPSRKFKIEPIRCTKE